MITLKTDLAGFTGAGYGSARIPLGVDLAEGQLIAVTDNEADTLEAEVVAVAGNMARVRVRWDRVLHKA